MLRQLAIAAILACNPLLASAALGVQQPIKPPTLGTDTVHGCYSSKGSLDNGRPVDFNSQGECNKVCRDQLKKAVAATYSGTCYCGDEYPPSSSIVAPAKCNEPCPGYDQHACGGLGTFTVYNTGFRVSVGESEPDTTSSAPVSSGTTPPAASSSTAAPSAQPVTDDNSSSGPPTVAIAVGVVVGILAITGVAGGVFFFMRRKRNNEIEEEHRRNAAVNAFINGGKPPGSSDGLSMSDSRLDPVIANRRMSDGSIADNQDYSRRILRVGILFHL
ncbi:uncharacterized protein B0I36DRAFT_245207 [Microdochium trichocladiopsis]|uniref:WSC domain-containing protein n=1 Tax=Microdochium trichocladiopsis TaxID=1682393 RepID=A0A9P8Y6U0_9PEZI|nr:uncharacterized protein B0I36DRAFT_245207 [Microdochium trichocladiopsis]KAH7029137.1 hypothetical protein B0I36DRAFT_245207 [Microdochium trichocladiopsis]